MQENIYSCLKVLPEILKLLGIDFPAFVSPFARRVPSRSETENTKCRLIFFTISLRQNSDDNFTSCPSFCSMSFLSAIFFNKVSTLVPNVLFSTTTRIFHGITNSHQVHLSPTYRCQTRLTQVNFKPFWLLSAFAFSLMRFFEHAKTNVARVAKSIYMRIEVECLGIPAESSCFCFIPFTPGKNVFPHQSYSDRFGTGDYGSGFLSLRCIFN